MEEKTKSVSAYLIYIYNTCPTNIVGRKTYILTEVNTLVFDAILLMIIIAILDDTFESKVALIEDILWV